MCLCAGFSSVQEIPRFMVLALVLVMVFVTVSAAVGVFSRFVNQIFRGLYDVVCGELIVWSTSQRSGVLTLVFVVIYTTNTRLGNLNYKIKNW